MTTTYYAIIDDLGRPTGLVRHDLGRGVAYLDRRDGRWVKDNEAYRYVVGIGGETDGVPVDETRARQIERELRLSEDAPATGPDALDDTELVATLVVRAPGQDDVRIVGPRRFVESTAAAYRDAGVDVRIEPTA